MIFSRNVSDFELENFQLIRGKKDDQLIKAAKEIQGKRENKNV